LFSIDGKATRKVRAGEVDPTHVGEKSISVRPLVTVTEVVILLEQLR